MDKPRNGAVYHDHPLGHDFSRAVVTPSGLVITAGHVAERDDGTMVDSPDVRDHMRQTLENLRATLAVCGATLDDVIKLTVYFADAEDWAAFNEVRREYVQPPFPASTGVLAAALDPSMRFELEAVAQLPAA